MKLVFHHGKTLFPFYHKAMSLQFLLLHVLFISCCALWKRNSLLVRSPAFWKYRAGKIPEANEDGSGYYERLQLDYDNDDSFRLAGSTKGFLKIDSFKRLHSKDPLMQWFIRKLDVGTETHTAHRLKPYYVRLRQLLVINNLFISLYCCCDC